MVRLHVAPECVVAIAMCSCTLCLAASARAEGNAVTTLEHVNLEFNHRIVFMTDLANWGTPDYWATPAELDARGAGDCEDFAIAKYFALRAAGVSPERLRLAYTEAWVGGAEATWRRHIVVAYLPPNGAAGSEDILDNLMDEVRPLAGRPDLRVLLSFDTDGIWPGLERGPPARQARAIRPWARLLDRMAVEH